MGLFSRMARSWKKSKKVRKLQRKISPPNQSTQDLAARMRKEGFGEREKTVQEFLDLCESDDDVSHVMEVENISRSDLEEIYHSLMVNGLGQWVKGHYAALSTIAYAEPLLYAVRAKAQGVGPSDIAFTLLEYWEGKIGHGSLIRRIH